MKYGTVAVQPAPVVVEVLELLGVALRASVDAKHL